MHSERRTSPSSWSRRVSSALLTFYLPAAPADILPPSRSSVPLGFFVCIHVAMHPCIRSLPTCSAHMCLREYGYEYDGTHSVGRFVPPRVGIYLLCEAMHWRSLDPHLASAILHSQTSSVKSPQYLFSLSLFKHFCPSDFLTIYSSFI